jgi:cytoskeletal protein CcmA (bactofilin family)
MAMFDNNSSKKNSPVMPTNINPGTMIEGNISSDGDIRLDGNMKGNLTTKAKVVIGPQGSIDGNIDCESADIFGKVNGDIHVKELLFMKNTSVVDGDIFTSKLVVENGAKFNGSCVMNSAVKAPMASEKKSKSTIEQAAQETTV